MSPSIKDIALECNVTPATVSLALNGHPRISRKRKDEVNAVARRLGYRPNMIAKSLSGGKTHSIGILWSLRRSTGIKEIQDMTLHFMKLGYVSYVADTLGDVKIIKATLRDYVARKIDGLIIQAPETHLYDPEIQKYLKQISNVVIENEFGPDNKYEFDTIISSRKQALSEIIEHLIATGRKKICLLDRPIYQNRVQELLELIGKYREVEIYYENNGKDSKANISAELIKKFDAGSVEYDAIVASYDELAAATISYLFERKIRVPEDIAVIGFNNTNLSQLFIPPIASVDCCSEEISSLAVEMLMEQICQKRIKPRTEHLNYKFIHRKSAG